MSFLSRHFTGQTAFYGICIGQLLSWTGSAMTRYALIIWAYEKTNAAATLGLLGFFGWIPLALISPIAGVLVDRWDRRVVMILADIGSGLVTALLLLLYVSDAMQIWHLFIAEALSAVGQAFQSPAYSTSISLLVPKERYTKAYGLLLMADYASEIGGPILAGLMLTSSNLNAVFVLDLATLLVAVGTLLPISLPKLSDHSEKSAHQMKFRESLSAGFKFIADRPGLLGNMLIFMMINLLAYLTYVTILPALILTRTGGDKMALSTVQGVLGVGGLIGSLLVSIWGGPKKRIHGYLIFTALCFLLSDSTFALGRTLPVWLIGGFISSIFIPFIRGCSMSIWMSKVPPALQGRVFSVRQMGHTIVIPIGYLAGGILADKVFEPAMAAGGTLAQVFGGLVGQGPGAGISLMFLITCILGTLTGLSGYLFPAIRNVEDELPDHGAGPKSPSQETASQALTSAE